MNLTLTLTLTLTLIEARSGWDEALKEKAKEAGEAALEISRLTWDCDTAAKEAKMREARLNDKMVKLYEAYKVAEEKTILTEKSLSALKSEKEVVCAQFRTQVEDLSKTLDSARSAEETALGHVAAKEREISDLGDKLKVSEEVHSINPNPNPNPNSRSPRRFIPRI